MDYMLLVLLLLCIGLLIAVFVRLGAQKSEQVKPLLDEQRALLSEELHRGARDTAENIGGLSRSLAEQKVDILQLQKQEQQALHTALNAQQEKLFAVLTAQQEQLFSTLNSQTEKVNTTLHSSVEKLQQSNEQKLDQMRATVDEKLSATLSERLDASFKAVGDQLQNVYKSLGEMQQLAGDVNTLQRVLSNVKTRGTWAEVQLGNILEQTLSAEQFAQNVSVRGNSERVEYAVKIPSKDNDSEFVWLPIDSKFPQEDYLRLYEAAEQGDKEATEAAAKALEAFIKKEAAKIAKLYIEVPKTTNFAILFLPTEGLYAEVLRRPALLETLQEKHRIMVCGPTTITAFLNTLAMGFRTIAINKRAAEVWEVLGATKLQYEKFAGILEKAHKKVTEAGSALEDAQKRATLIQSKLRRVELPDGEGGDPAANADRLLGLSELPDSE